MIYGIISDIHGNLEALEAMLARLEKMGAEKIVCLGDLVGYGASPNECVDRVRDVSEIVLPGNHDSAAVGTTSIDYFNPFARDAVLWTRDQLTPKNAEYLKDLEMTSPIDSDFLAVHATPCSPEKWDYIMGIEDAILQFNCFVEWGCFVGHSHQPVMAEVMQTGEVTMSHFNQKVSLDTDSRYIFNVGSVGQPRDGDPRASAGILDIADGAKRKAHVLLVREPYDLATAQDKILDAGLPSILASRLAAGQ